ncbi:M28 family peptidase [Adhaeribacter aquaticus]|uniref:M28 family peptidase n=1 Tax=Adhaeribacter aquaticus TaxID=299567 RepID=UPI000419F475|nr:M28 family peptidase [Adhaeribacter aquaticus]
MYKYLVPVVLLLAGAPGCTKKAITSTTSKSSANNQINLEQLRTAAPTYAATITPEDLTKHLTILASDEYEGREAGEKGQKMAAEYIKNQFKANGLVGPVKGGPDNYLQSFDLERAKWGEVYVRVNNKAFKFIEDFYVLGDTPFDKETNIPVVFAGYGIEDKKYSDYKNLGVDVTGKAVVIFAGEPVNSQGQSLITGTNEKSNWATDYRNKAALAREKGANVVILITGKTTDNFKKTAEDLRPSIMRDKIGRKREGNPAFKLVPTVFASPDLGAALLGSSVSKLGAYLTNGATTTRKPAFSVAKTVTIRAEKLRTPAPTENVLGYLEGTDKKEELIVITAHYDHVGKEGNKIFNGADDDGSGTVAVLEMAEAFAKAKKEGFGPRRSILFMTVTAEEKGLLGSEYYVNHPVFALTNTVANLNIDMIGRLDPEHATNKNYVYVIGSDKLSSELHAISEQTNSTYTKLELDYKFNDPNDPNRIYYRSDHYNFAKNKIPAAFYFNGVHEDYHKETDEVDKILFDKVKKITDLVFYTAWDLVNREERIKVDSNKP